MFKPPVRFVRRVAQTKFKTRRLEVEEMEPRWTPATSGMMTGTLATVASASSATVLNQHAARVLLSAQPSALATALAQPITPAASAAAFAANPSSPGILAGVREGALPANLLTQLGYVGMLQRDPRAASDLSIVLSGGDESEVPITAQPSVTVPVPTGILSLEDGSDGTTERDALAAANPGDHISATDITEAPAAHTSGEAEPVQQIP
jgi:hypothetical protein